jgi:DtxR family Mn-dependent transcriptional regulator
MAHYLGSLFRLGGQHSYISLSALASEVDVSTPAAARMVGRMEAAGLAEREPYRGVRLSQGGAREALREIRSHRLSEAFLVRVLGYGWHEAHDLADRLAEIGDETFVDRMEAKAGYPRRCPHGEPIPSRDGEMSEPNDLPLTELASGEAGTISRVRLRDSAKLEYLANEGLLPEVEFAVEAKAPFGGPIRLRIGRREVLLGSEIAAKILVERAAGA